MKNWNLTHPGKKVISVTGKRVRPLLRVVVNPEVDGKKLATVLTARVKEVAEAVTRSVATEVLEYREYGLQFECSEEEILPGDAQYQQEREATIVVYGEDNLPWAPHSSEIDNHPDDGTYGVWLVSGIRHSCLVRCVSTARQAWHKALDSGGVGEWEVYEIKFVGQDLPDVIRV
ncbi:hypothetical protein LPW11_09880 [Geomonas sp. RF6]|uniref:hypothetical protein n=1 Tax=Geomonas sp. RF6 TaxID=2897342 RepID=UPI001E2C99D0|nr:hypothetical protein [Geomonas sp. RF6]UFS72483.1 hypothetical protein LPW11_09880 [Geomonas sp. RF6]